MKRSQLETLAQTLNFTLTPASDRVEMEAVYRGSPKPRWMLNPDGNQRADGLFKFVTLAHVEAFLS